MKTHSVKNVIAAYAFLKAFASMEGVTVQTKIREIERYIKQFGIEDNFEEVIKELQSEMMEEINNELSTDNDVEKGYMS